jgi:hypothetical protein
MRPSVQPVGTTNDLRYDGESQLAGKIRVKTSVNGRTTASRETTQHFFLEYCPVGNRSMKKLATHPVIRVRDVASNIKVYVI